MIWTYLVIGKWPMRWLMKRPVRWALYAGPALAFAALYALRKGWL